MSILNKIISVLPFHLDYRVELYPMTRQLILEKSFIFPDTKKSYEGSRLIAAKMKDADTNKVKLMRKDWNTLAIKVPIEYLNALNITKEILESTIELDRNHYKHSVHEYIASYEGAVCTDGKITQTITFVNELDEIYAIQECQAFLGLNEDYTEVTLTNHYYKVHVTKYDYVKEFIEPSFKIEDGYYIFNQASV